MEVARFEFKKEAAAYFAWGEDQCIVEMAFPNIIDLIEYIKEFEELVENVSVLTEGKVISIKEFTN